MNGNATPLDHAELAEEVDLWWGGRHVRTLLPVLAATAGVTVLLLLFGVFVWASQLMSGSDARRLAYALTIILWVSQLARWLYLTAAVTYRLTTRRLFVEDGFVRPKRIAVELEHIVGVWVVRKGFDVSLNLGQLEVSCQGVKTPRLVLEKVDEPERIAELILLHAERRRAPTIVPSEPEA